MYQKKKAGVENLYVLKTTEPASVHALLIWASIFYLKNRANEASKKTA